MFYFPRSLIGYLFCVVIVTQFFVYSDEDEDGDDDNDNDEVSLQKIWITNKKELKLKRLPEHVEGTIKKLEFRSKGQQPNLLHHVMFFKNYTKSFPYRAFCGGSIITNNRVLSSTSCFLTHKKRNKHDLNEIKVVAGLLQTTAAYPGKDNTKTNSEQWRSIKKIYTQKFFRAPNFDLAVVEITQKWILNENVIVIPYASLNQDFDGVCSSIAIKPASSWSTTKLVYVQDMNISPRESCENILLTSCRLHYCTVNDGIEMEGSGLICYETGDPNEKSDKGVLVGVSSQINVGLPSLYTRVAIFNKWVTDGCLKSSKEVLLLFMSCAVIIIL